MGMLAVVAAAAVTQACATQSDALRTGATAATEQAANTSVDFGATANDARAVARRLRAIEQSACADVSVIDRDQGPFAQRDRIASMQTLRDRRMATTQVLQPAGVAVYLRSAPGLTEQSLERVLQCHLAHHAVVGDQGFAKPSPLFVEDARIALSTTTDGFRVAITAREASAAREIIEKARMLVQ